jgi:class 3 adenylate cyclase
MERFPSAILFADISGFTTFTEELDSRSPKGLEDVADILNRTFTDLIAIIQDFGGDVVKFAGDALWAIWPVETDPVEMICQALLCGQKIQATFSENPETVSLRVSISSGNISVMHVGGVFGRWEMIIAGEPLTNLGDADRLGHPGEIVLSRGYPEALLEWIEAVPLDKGCLRVTAVRHPRISIPEPVFTDISERNLRGYIPGAILKRLDAGQSEWLGEIRKLTTVFIRITGFDYEREDSLTKAHQFMRRLQSIIYYYEGSLNRLNVDDKGTIMLAAFGLSPLSHEDDALRAIRAMWDIRREIRRMGLVISIGVTTGRAFCGSLGTEFRREYTMHGDVVNLAARLMQKASMGWGILCDENTMREAAGYYRFEILPGVKLKGRRTLSTLYAPIDPIEKRDISAMPTVERKAERAIISGKIEELVVNRKGGVIILEGEAGIGKSNLLSFAAKRAEIGGIGIAFVTGEGILQSYPFYSLQTFFNKILRKMERAVLSDVLHEFPDCSSLLINGFESEFKKIDTPLDAPSALKKRRIQELLGAIFHRYYGRKSVLFLIEDARWIDADTWAFLASIKQTGPNILFLIAARPRSGTAASAPFYEDAEALYLHLEPMDDKEIVSLISLRLRGCEVGADLAAFIMKHSEGYPHLAVEITDSLFEKGYIKNDGRVCSFRVDPSQIEEDEFPITLQGVVLERIDRLPPDLQLVLKCASVVGEEFTPELLTEIFPLPVSIDQIRAHLSSLDNYDFIIRKRSFEQTIYGFRNAFIQSAAYRMLLFSQRQMLHRMVAKWYENGDDRELHLPEIAHHLEHALEIENAYGYLIRAGEFFAKQRNLRLAASYLNRALRMHRAHFLKHSSDEVGPLISLAGGLLEQGRLRNAKRGLRHILEGVGREDILSGDMPSISLKILLKIYNIFPFLLSIIPLRPHDQRPHNSDLYLLLGDYEAFAQNYEKSVESSLRALNSMRPSDPVRSLALSRIALSAHLCGLRRVAGKYSKIVLEPGIVDSAVRIGVVRNLSELALASRSFAAGYEKLFDTIAAGAEEPVLIYLAGRYAFMKGDDEGASRYFDRIGEPERRLLNEPDAVDLDLYRLIIRRRGSGVREADSNAFEFPEIDYPHSFRFTLVREALRFQPGVPHSELRLRRIVRSLKHNKLLDPVLNEIYSHFLDRLYRANRKSGSPVSDLLRLYRNFARVYEFAWPRYIYYTMLFDVRGRESTSLDEMIQLTRSMHYSHDLMLLQTLAKKQER